ncbi:MAG TPA: DNA internalization-related competence protein ComEC/Rec2 [Thermoanaerobaculia bacterium]|jgi:competence protein ComEC|nr:DNA internalization-related competence protein ComEC/Rec2 [Thermoanaerobaculia bacterium]
MKNNAPLFLPSLSLALGAWASFHLTSLSIPLLVAVAVLGLALRRPAGFCVTALAVGMIAAAVRHELPAGFDLDRPIEAVVRVSGHWTPDSPDDEPGWSAPAEVLRLRQDGLVAQPRLEVLLHVPGAEDPPPFGTSLRLKAYLDRSSGFANRVPVEPGPWRIRVKSRRFLNIEAPAGPIAALSASLRGRVEKAYRAAGPDGSGKALARALILGDASAFPMEWKRGLRVTGLYHLLSVSGVHVALVAAAVWLLSGWLPRVLRLVLMLAAIALYLLLVGPLPALVRAAVMGFLAVTALLAERPPAAVNALGWAVILLVLERPDIVLSVAFQLTVSATAGLLLLGPPLAERWRGLPRWLRLPRWLASSLAASVGAQLLTIPWALPRFHLLSPLAPLFNLPAVPWTGLALSASLLWTGAALVSPQMAGTLLPVLDFFAVPFSWPARTGPSLWLPLPLVLSPLAAWLLALLLALTLFIRPRLKLLGLAGLALLLSGSLPRSRGVELAMLDVGQGDAILLRDGPHAVLVDGGGWRTGDLGGRVLLPALLAEGVRSLDAVIMTHPDRDHCGGLVDIAAYLPVREVLMGPGWEPEGCVGSLAALPGARMRVVWAGETASVGKWNLRVLHPDREEDRGTNERSLVIRAEALGRSFLLTGDIESWAEMRLLSCCEDEVQVDVLKVAHHGSKTSSTESFLDAARPRLALVSAGVNNLYHHPSPLILDRLSERGIRVLRTDRDGLILLRLSTGGMRIELPGAPR